MIYMQEIIWLYGRARSLFAMTDPILGISNNMNMVYVLKNKTKVHAG